MTLSWTAHSKGDLWLVGNQSSLAGYVERTQGQWCGRVYDRQASEVTVTKQGPFDSLDEAKAVVLAIVRMQ